MCVFYIDNVLKSVKMASKRRQKASNSVKRRQIHRSQQSILNNGRLWPIMAVYDRLWPFMAIIDC